MNDIWEGILRKYPPKPHPNLFGKDKKNAKIHKTET